jgi:hypothetical protein
MDFKNYFIDINILNQKIETKQLHSLAPFFKQIQN